MTDEKKRTGWGKENLPYPKGIAFIECDEMKCVGCGICQMACSMKHFGVINKELSRIQVQKYLLPLPKAVQVTCLQCQAEERECQKACPVSPAVIYFDDKLNHMVINEERCLGNKCLLCQAACPAKAVISYPQGREKPFVCDLCDIEGNGVREPQCVDVCPTSALNITESAASRVGYPLNQDNLRKHPDDKAKLIARRLYPLDRTNMGKPSWR